MRRSRRRFWGEGEDTQDALRTLYEVLTTLSRLIAPFVPFMAEAMYLSLEAGQRRDAAASVHLCEWPSAQPGWRSPELAEDMALVRELASLGLATRKKVGVRVRQPLAAMEVILARPERTARVQALVELLTDELNVREVRFSTEPERFVEFKVKPNYKALGARLGKDMKACAAQLGAMPGAVVRSQVLGGGLALELPSGTVVLGPEEIVVEVQPREHFQAAGSAEAVVALHTDLDADLREEGLARELLSRVQGLRKDQRLGYVERAELTLAGDEALLAAARRFADFIADEALLAAWRFEEPAGEGAVALDIDGLALRLRLVPV